MNNELIAIDNLSVWFENEGKKLVAVDNISFHVNKGEILGVVGESGCGKSMTSLAVMGLLPRNAKTSADRIMFEDIDLCKKNSEYRRTLRGDRISMIFQEPMTSLNPVLKIGKQMEEVLKEHRSMDKAESEKLCIDMLRRVGIAAPERCMKSYAYEMSGGMRQRVMIAMALLCNPAMLIADEPTTALDVTIQAQILELIKKLSRENNMSVMIITHDLGVIAEICDRVLVMYAGEIVEAAEAKELFKNPQHPYTKGLLSSIPTIDDDRERLNVIKGMVPGLAEMPAGCKFNPRCEYVQQCCKGNKPPRLQISDTHFVSCYNCTPLKGV